MFVSYCYLLSFRKLTTPFTLKRLLISKEEKELVNTHLSQSLGHLDATDTSEYVYVSILH